MVHVAIFVLTVRREGDPLETVESFEPGEMMRLATTVTIGCISALSLAGLSLVPAAASADAGHRTDAASFAGEDPTAAAARTYAETNGVTVQEATTAVEDQDLVVAAIDALNIHLGLDADVWIEQEGVEQHVTVRTRQKPLGVAFQQLPLSEGTTVTVVEGDPVASGAADLDAPTEAVVREAAPGVQGMYVRTSDGALVVETTDDPLTINAAELAARTGFAAVVVEQVESASDSILVRGGVALGGCTAGFSAKYGSYIGYFSAAHCGTSQATYSNTTGTGTSVTGTRRAQNHGANADIAFYSIPAANSVSKTFFGSSATSPTSVGGPQDVPEGITVCHRGKTSGWRCGKITSITYKPTWSGACLGSPCNPVFVRVEAAQAGGDSGGPWVNGNSPIGIHKGGASSWSVFSKLYRIPSGTSLY